MCHVCTARTTNCTRVHSRYDASRTGFIVQHITHSSTETTAVVSTETTAATTAESGCPKCGTLLKTGKSSCCGRGGAWAGKCADEVSDDFDHTWIEGIKMCSSATALNSGQETSAEDTEYVESGISDAVSSQVCAKLTHLVGYTTVALLSFVLLD